MISTIANNSQIGCFMSLKAAKDLPSSSLLATTKATEKEMPRSAHIWKIFSRRGAILSPKNSLWSKSSSFSIAERKDWKAFGAADSSSSSASCSPPLCKNRLTSSAPSPSKGSKCDFLLRATVVCSFLVNIGLHENRWASPGRKVLRKDTFHYFPHIVCVYT